jgi:hypothetical protein
MCGDHPPGDLLPFTPICHNFDCLYYDFIYYIIRQYVLDDNTVALFKGLYAHISSPCQIYGLMSAAFRLSYLVTHSFPPSMFMYALILNTLLTKFDETLSSLRLNTEAKKVVVTVYVKDSNITLTDPTDIPLLHNILYTHEQSTDAKINNSKLRTSFCGNGTRPLMYWVSLISLKQEFYE